MTMTKMQGRLSRLEGAAGSGDPVPRIILTDAGQDRHAAIAEAGLKPNERPLVVVFR